jgi:hypothetical protein
MCFGAGPLCAPIAATLTSAFVAGVTSGKLSMALKAGLITAVTIAAFQVVGDFTGHFEGAPLGGHARLDFASPAHIFNIAGHAGVGCLSAIASGGKCGPGAASAAIGAASSPFVNTGSVLGNAAAHAVVGGAASAASGGSFHEGAATAAFGYLFNAEAGRTIGRVVGAAVGWAVFTADDGPLAGGLGSRFGSEMGGQLFSDWEDAYYAKGPYSNLQDPTGAGMGKDFTPEQRRLIIEENMRRNGGVVRSDLSGEILSEPTRSQRGVVELSRLSRRLVDLSQAASAAGSSRLA